MRELCSFRSCFVRWYLVYSYSKWLGEGGEEGEGERQYEGVGLKVFLSKINVSYGVVHYFFAKHTVDS